MRKILRFGPLCLGPFFALALGCGSDDVTGVSNNDFLAKAPFGLEVPLDGQSAFRLIGISGSVQIEGVAGATAVTVTGEKRVRSDSTEDAEEHLSDLQVETTESDTEIEVRTIQPAKTLGRSYVVDYEVTLPRSMIVLVQIANGEVTVQSVDDSVGVQCANGPVFLVDITGSSQVNVANGAIEASQTLSPEGVLEFVSANGGIDLTIPTETSAQFSAVTGIGGAIVLSGLSLQDEVRIGTSVTGVLGEGNGTISLRTATGGITVRGIAGS